MSDEKAKMKTKEYWLKVGHDDEFSALYAEVHQKAYSREQCLNRGISFAGRTKFENLEMQKNQNRLDTDIYEKQIALLNEDIRFIENENQLLWKLVTDLKMQQTLTKNRS